MQQWQYQTTAPAATDMNAMGSDGWRLVSVDSGVMFWERPMEPEPEREAPAPAKAKSKSAADED